MNPLRIIFFETVPSSLLYLTIGDFQVIRYCTNDLIYFYNDLSDFL